MYSIRQFSDQTWPGDWDDVLAGIVNLLATAQQAAAYYEGRWSCLAVSTSESHQQCEKVIHQVVYDASKEAHNSAAPMA